MDHTTNSAQGQHVCTIMQGTTVVLLDKVDRGRAACIFVDDFNAVGPSSLAAHCANLFFKKNGHVQYELAKVDDTGTRAAPVAFTASPAVPMSSAYPARTYNQESYGLRGAPSFHVPPTKKA